MNYKPKRSIQVWASSHQVSKLDDPGEEYEHLLEPQQTLEMRDLDTDTKKLGLRRSRNNMSPEH
jgi:hypothetical protein